MKQDSAQRLRELLSYFEINQQELSIRTGIAKSAISMYMNGQRIPRQDKISDISEAFGVNEAWLMGYDVPMFGPTNNGDFDDEAPTGYAIDVLGRVAAGIPIEMIADKIGIEEISPEMKSKGKYFALKIHGQSMEPRLEEGDIVIVRQQADAESGDIVIATVGNEDATCKRLKKYRDGIALISTNPSYEPMYFSDEEVENLPVCILGKVVEARLKDL